jgi:hypothetical protein
MSSYDRYIPVIYLHFIISAGSKWVCTKQQLSEHGTSIYRYIPNQRVDGFSLWETGVSILGRYMEVYTSHVTVQHTGNTSCCFKCKIIHFLASSVRKMYMQVHRNGCSARVGRSPMRFTIGSERLMATAFFTSMASL